MIVNVLQKVVSYSRIIKGLESRQPVRENIGPSSGTDHNEKDGGCTFYQNALRLEIV